MLNYAILEIKGKQYKVTPGKPLDIFSEFEPDQSIEAAVLLLMEDGKVKLGKPYLKDKITLKCSQKKGIKVHVRKYHAKANYRRTSGSKSYAAQVVLPVEKVS